MRYQLDQDFDSLRNLLFAPDAQPTDSHMVSLHNSGDLSPGPHADINEQLDYDRQVRELAFDQRAKPKDRTKTEEELALEEKEALEKAEMQRKRRMLGEDGEDNDEYGKSHGKRKRDRGGDDLEDDFVQDESFGGLGAGLGEVGVNDESSEEEEDLDGSADDQDETSDEDDDDETEDKSGDSSGSDSEGEFDEITTSQKSTKIKLSSVPEELPFTFPCPESHKQFLEIVEGISDSDMPTVVQRIRTLHHPSLVPENKLKLQVALSFNCYSRS